MKAQAVSISPGVGIAEVATAPPTSPGTPKQDFATLMAQASPPVVQSSNAKTAMSAPVAELPSKIAMPPKAALTSTAAPSEESKSAPLPSVNAPTKMLAAKDSVQLETAPAPAPARTAAIKDDSTESEEALKTAKGRKTDAQKTSSPEIVFSVANLSIEAQANAAAVLPGQSVGGGQNTILHVEDASAPLGGRSQATDLSKKTAPAVAAPQVAPTANSHQFISTDDKNSTEKQASERKTSSQETTASGDTSATTQPAHAQSAIDPSASAAVKGSDDSPGLIPSASSSASPFVPAAISSSERVANIASSSVPLSPSSEHATSAQNLSASASNTGLPHTAFISTPTSLEVGVASGTHGWLKVRAELSETGEVSASLTGSSQAAASKLQGDLPALTSFLQAEKLQISALAVHGTSQAAAVPMDSSSGSGPSSYENSGSLGGAGGGGAGDQSQQQTGQGPNKTASPDGGEMTADIIFEAQSGMAYGSGTGLGGNESQSPVGYGSWLNVRV